MSRPLSFREVVREDFRVNGLSSQKGFLSFCFLLLRAFLVSPPAMCVFWYRCNVQLHMFSPRLARVMATWRLYVFGNDISHRAIIGKGLRLCHLSDVVIGARVVVGDYLTIYNGVTLGAKHFNAPDKKPIIGNFVTIGTGAKVLGAVTIGDYVTIGALSFCDKSVPKGALAYGIPVVIYEGQNELQESTL